MVVGFPFHCILNGFHTVNFVCDIHFPSKTQLTQLTELNWSELKWISVFVTRYRTIAVTANLSRTKTRQRVLSSGNGKKDRQRDHGHRLSSYIRDIGTFHQQIHCARLSDRDGQGNSNTACAWYWFGQTHLSLFTQWFGMSFYIKI